MQWPSFRSMLRGAPLSPPAFLALIPSKLVDSAALSRRRSTRVLADACGPVGGNRSAAQPTANKLGFRQRPHLVPKGQDKRRQRHAIAPVTVAAKQQPTGHHSAGIH